MQSSNMLPEAATAQPKLATFIDDRELCERLGICRRTASILRKKGLPFIRVGGIRYHWPSIESWMLRQQRGGEQ
jgi:hypothetical protein